MNNVNKEIIELEIYTYRFKSSKNNTFNVQMPSQFPILAYSHTCEGSDGM